jgi:hypothetical protein
MAGWPSGGIRTVSGKACTPFRSAVDSYVSDCPYVSDFVSSGDSYFANNVGGIYADLDVASSGGSTGLSACRQRWTGAAVACTSPAFTSGTGYQHVYVNPFSSIGGATDQYDYYYISISTTQTVDAIYGVMFGP